MNRQVSFHAMAEQELNDAASYYNASRPGLGQAFLDEIERAVTQILEYPEAAPLVNRTVRKKLVRRFPYSVCTPYALKASVSWPLRTSNAAPFTGAVAGDNGGLVPIQNSSCLRV
jgi:hypothetical protein